MHHAHTMPFYPEKSVYPKWALTCARFWRHILCQLGKACVRAIHANGSEIYLLGELIFTFYKAKTAFACPAGAPFVVASSAIANQCTTGIRSNSIDVKRINKILNNLESNARTHTKHFALSLSPCLAKISRYFDNEMNYLFCYTFNVNIRCLAETSATSKQPPQEQHACGCCDVCVTLASSRINEYMYFDCAHRAQERIQFIHIYLFIKASKPSFSSIETFETEADWIFISIDSWISWIK